MRILMVAGHFNLKGDKIPTGGVQRHISYVTEELKKRNHKIEWCHNKNAHKTIRNFNPHIIIAHDFFSYIKGINIPQITIFHGYEGNVPPLKNIINTRLEIESLSNATICVGDYLKIWYHHNPDKVIYGGISLVKNIPLPKRNKILYLGRLDPDQAPDLAFEAFIQNPKRREYSIDVCGSGSKIEDFIKKSKKNKLDIKFHGFIENPDEFIKNADIVICSGYLTILESYINKRPVISPYLNKLKKDYLKYIPCPPYMFNNPIQMYNKINDLMLNPDMSIINKNYKYAKENTWEKVCDIYEELIEKCIRV